MKNEKRTNKSTNKKKSSLTLGFVLFGTPKGNRTPDSTVRGWRLNRLTIGA